MTTVLLFHHAQGRTSGFIAFADELRVAGHTVHVPDLSDGKTFGNLDDCAEFWATVETPAQTVGERRYLRT